MGPCCYRPQRSCGQGYVFTRVCDSVHSRGGLPKCMLGYHTPPGSRHPPGKQAPLPLLPGSRRPRHTVNERSVRILLKNAFLFLCEKIHLWCGWFFRPLLSVLAEVPKAAKVIDSWILLIRCSCLSGVWVISIYIDLCSWIFFFNSVFYFNQCPTVFPHP